MADHPRPVVQILAGVNGAGKSTLYEQNLDKSYPFINPDVIASQIAPDDVNNPRVSMQAGREALNQIQQALNSRQSFTFETTLSSHQALKTLQDAKTNGYQVILHYIGLISKETSAGRVARRVAEGGHDIPNEALMRRYDKSMANLPKAMLLSDSINIYDNSGLKRKLLYQRTDNQVIFCDKNLPAWAETAIEQYERTIADTSQNNAASSDRQESATKTIYPSRAKLEQHLSKLRGEKGETESGQSAPHSDKPGKNYRPG